MKREMKNITIQLNEYNDLKSLKKIDSTLFDKEIENLAYSINKHIDINIQSQIKQKRLEEEIRKNIANVSHDLRTPPYIYHRLYTNDKKRQSIKGKANRIYRHS
nr:hypothetical protein [Clostridium botulinum]